MWMIKSRRKRWAEHVAGHIGMRRVFAVLLGTHERKSLQVKTRSRLEK
jgi:hypothetical protein